MKAFLFDLLLLVIGVAQCSARVTDDASLHSSLDFSHPVSVLLRQGNTVTLTLDTRGSQAEELFLDAAAQNVAFHIVSSNGTDMESGLIATYGWAAIPLAIRGQSQVQLLLSIKDAAEGLPGIRVRTERLSIPPSTLPAEIQAAHAFTYAESLHRSVRGEDLRQAIIQFQKAADEWGRCGNRYGEVLALGGKAESQIELSRYREAIPTLQHALGLNPNSAYLHGWLNHFAARVYLDQWEPQPAKGFAQETLQLGKEIGDPALIALGRTDLVGVAFWNFDDNANDLDEQAHAEAIAAGVPETLGLERQWKAWIEENFANDTRAASITNEAEAYFRRAGDLRIGLEATGQVAQAIRLTGDSYSALSRLLALEPMTKASGNLLYYGILIENIGEIHLGLGKPRFAMAYLKLAENAYANAHFRRGLMDVYGDLCETESRLGEVSNAVADCKTSLILARQTQEPVFIGNAEYQLGLANRKAGRPEQAFINFTEAIRNSHIRTNLISESKERIQLGELFAESGKKSEALDQFLTAQRLVQDATDPKKMLEAQFSVAHWYQQNGQHEKANAELKPAIEKLEATRQAVFESTLQASYFAAERKCYELAVELRMQEFARDPSGAGDALALELSEQGRARSLLDAQAASVAGRKRDDVRTSLLRSNLAVDRAFDHRLKLLVSGAAKRDLQTSAAELTQALGTLERVEDTAHTAVSDALKPAATMSAAAIEQASLSSGVTFFEYALGDEHSYLWVIAAGKRRSVVLRPRAQLEAMVKHWTALAASQEKSEENSAHLQHLSAALSCALLADSVEAGMTRMVIVSDGALSMLPFAALPEKGCSRKPGKPLVVGHEITSTPSLSVYFSRKPKVENGAFRGQVAIVADPVFDAGDPRASAFKAKVRNSASQRTPAQSAFAIPRLLNAGYEANAIQAVVTKAAGKGQVFLAQGFDANLDTVLSPAMRDYRIWHLATHGVYDESMPEFSGLVFSLVGPDGSSQFGFLKAHDIALLDVPAELVVLSACETAAGENLSGEGVMGLSYSFLRAGARQVVSTLWSIDDSQSKELMVAFYKELMRNGGNAAAALRQSQLIVMRQPHNSMPYSWAGFQLTSLGE